MATFVEQDMNRFYRYPAYTSIDESDRRGLTSDSSVKWISNQITARLDGVHPQGKIIVVPDSAILSMIDSFRDNTRIDADTVRQQVVLYIVEQVTLDFKQTEMNNNLSAWNQILTDDKGIKAFEGVKVQQKRRTPFTHWTY